MELEGLLLLADVASNSCQSLFDTNSDHKDQEEDSHKFEFRDLFMLADVTSSMATTASHHCNTTNKKKKMKQKHKTKQNLPKPKSSVSNSWSLQLHGNSNLKLRFNKIKNTTFISSSSTSTRTSSNPIHLLSQVAFAYKTSTLWALCPNSIPTKTRSTYNRRRRPNNGLPHLLATTFAGNKRRFAETKSFHIKINANKRRKVAQSLPFQLSNYLATKKAVSEPTSDDESTITSF